MEYSLCSVHFKVSPCDLCICTCHDVMFRSLQYLTMLFMYLYLPWCCVQVSSTSHHVLYVSVPAMMLCSDLFNISSCSLCICTCHDITFRSLQHLTMSFMCLYLPWCYFQISSTSHHVLYVSVLAMMLCSDLFNISPCPLCICTCHDVMFRSLQHLTMPFMYLHLPWPLLLSKVYWELCWPSQCTHLTKAFLKHAPSAPVLLYILCTNLLCRRLYWEP